MFVHIVLFFFSCYLFNLIIDLNNMQTIFKAVVLILIHYPWFLTGLFGAIVGCSSSFSLSPPLSLVQGTFIERSESEEKISSMESIWFDLFLYSSLRWNKNEYLYLLFVKCSVCLVCCFGFWLFPELNVFFCFLLKWWLSTK